MCRWQSEFPRHGKIVLGLSLVLLLIAGAQVTALALS